MSKSCSFHHLRYEFLIIRMCSRWFFTLNLPQLGRRQYFKAITLMEKLYPFFFIYAIFLMFNFFFFFGINTKSGRINTSKVGPATLYHKTTQVKLIFEGKRFFLLMSAFCCWLSEQCTAADVWGARGPLVTAKIMLYQRVN